MKTKEVIRLLQEADPTGEEEVSVGNQDVYDVRKEPAYWDGCQQILIRDESLNCYNVIGAKYTSEGSKIVISPMSIDRAVWENPDLPVEFEGDLAQDYQERVKKYRKQVRDFDEECKKRKASKEV